MHATPLRSHCIARLAGFLALGIAASSWAQIADPPVVPASPFPGDRIGVPLLSGGQCEQGTLDPARPPQIRIASLPGTPPFADRTTYQLDYWLLDAGVVCAIAVPRTFNRLVDIGPLPDGLHQIYVTQRIDGRPELTYVALPFNVARRDEPNLDISGIWWSPDQSGRGLTVVRTAGTYALYWATHDADGEPDWITLITPDAADATLQGTAINTSGTPLAPGIATLTTNAWGEVRFVYDGCGRATFSWDALDTDIGEGTLALTQAGVPLGVPPCDVAALSDVEATWVED